MDDFDLNSAWVRRAQTDFRAFMEALAARLEGALPGHVKVERKRDNLFAKGSHTSKIVFITGDKVFEIKASKTGLIASRSKSVRDVVISSSELPLGQWLEDVRLEVRALADRAGAASDQLRDFL